MWLFVFLNLSRFALHCTSRRRSLLVPFSIFKLRKSVMANRRERDSFDGDSINGLDHVDPSNGEGLNDPTNGDEDDGDLLLHQTNNVLKWLQALDMQYTGACRADERLKPLLKINASCEDPLLTQLSQHFEPLEVGMLARCFCVPLVSIRVGKIIKEGTRMCPTANRGNLTLLLLPSSDLHLSFIGDDGNTQKIFRLTSESQCSAVVVDEIPTDSSGRSFFVRSPDGRAFYFWCSEKSKLLGIELLAKMTDLLKRKPSIAELSGISKSRLDCFATQLRAFLGGSTVGSSHENSVHTSTPSANFTASCDNAFENSYSSSTSKFLPSRHSSGQALKGNAALYLGCLSPRSSCFKETSLRNLSSLRSAAREKIKCRGDNHQSVVDKLTNDSGSILDSSIHSDSGKTPEVTKNCAFSPSSFLGSLGRLTVPLSLGSGVEVPPVVSPLFSPYYCWCPPGVSTRPSLAALSEFPDTSVESPPVPSGALLLSNTSPASLLEPVQPLNLSTAMDFPPFLPDPLVRMSLQSSQQIHTFTPLMCDPIVHVPVIDVCSSGQGYLVSAGPALSTSIQPLHPKLVKPLIPESDAVVKGARETLRLLISGSSQGNQQLMMDPLPAILTNPDEKQNNILVAGSRGLYSGARDIDVIANSIAAMGLVSLSGSPRGEGESDSELCVNFRITEQAVKKPSDSGGAFSDGEDVPSLDTKLEE